MATDFATALYRQAEAEGGLCNCPPVVIASTRLERHGARPQASSHTQGLNPQQATQGRTTTGDTKATETTASKTQLLHLADDLGQVASPLGTSAPSQENRAIKGVILKLLEARRQCLHL
jgi:hypothetical protein